jgi:hypothetical protein
MTAGPGKYDDEVTWVRERTHAAGVVLIVVGGDRGAGFAVQATPEATLDLPAVLRSMADQIDADTMKTDMANFKAWLHPDD